MILFNIILYILLTIDYFVAGKIEKPREFKSIFFSRRNYQAGARGGYEIINYIEFKDYDIYKIGNVPNIQFKENQKINIIRSSIFKKVIKLRYYETEWKTVGVSFLSKKIVFFCLVLTFLFTIRTIYNKSEEAEEVFILASSFFYIIIFMYLLII